MKTQQGNREYIETSRSFHHSFGRDLKDEKFIFATFFCELCAPQTGKTDEGFQHWLRPSLAPSTKEQRSIFSSSLELVCKFFAIVKSQLPLDFFLNRPAAMWQETLFSINFDFRLIFSTDMLLSLLAFPRVNKLDHFSNFIPRKRVRKIREHFGLFTAAIKIYKNELQKMKLDFRNSNASETAGSWETYKTVTLCVAHPFSVTFKPISCCILRNLTGHF